MFAITPPSHGASFSFSDSWARYVCVQLCDEEPGFCKTTLYLHPVTQLEILDIFNASLI